jgi:hypothetical protein
MSENVNTCKVCNNNIIGARYVKCRTSSNHFFCYDCSNGEEVLACPICIPHDNGELIDDSSLKAKAKPNSKVKLTDGSEKKQARNWNEIFNFTGRKVSSTEPNAKDTIVDLAKAHESDMKLPQNNRKRGQTFAAESFITPESGATIIRTTKAYQWIGSLDIQRKHINSLKAS